MAAASGGNPFALGEYVRMLIDGGQLRPVAGGWAVDTTAIAGLALPDDVLELVLGRVAALSEESAFVLRRAAVAGMRFDAELLAAIAGGEEAVSRALEDGVQSSLIERHERGRYTFVHDRVRDALAQSLGEAGRRAAHQAAAEVLDARADATPEQIYEVARHYAEGGAERHAARTYATNLAAGLRALANHSNEEAHRFLEHARAAGAAADTGGLALYEALGLACLRTGRMAGAYEHLGRALTLAGGPLNRARIRAHLGRAFLGEGKSAEAWAEVERGLRALGQPLPRFRPGGW